MLICIKQNWLFIGSKGHYHSLYYLKTCSHDSSIKKESGQWPSWKMRFKQFQAFQKQAKLDKLAWFCTVLAQKKRGVRLNKCSGGRKKYSTILAKFNSFFKARKNIFEWAKFNWHCRQEEEITEHFIAALFNLAKNYNYEDFKDELIRDRQYSFLTAVFQKDFKWILSYL